MPRRSRRWRRWSRHEGILPALESAHALAGAQRWAQENPGKTILVASRGVVTKDMATLLRMLDKPELASPRERISQAIRAAAAAGEPALVAYLTAGYPQRDKFRAHVRAIAAPRTWWRSACRSPDLMADGMTIQRASLSALSQGVSLRWILAELAELADVQAPILLMSYLESHCSPSASAPWRWPRNSRRGRLHRPGPAAGREQRLRAALDEQQIALVQMVNLRSPRPSACGGFGAGSEGFVYAVTMTGTTGKSVVVPDEVLGYLDAVPRPRCRCALVSASAAASRCPGCALPPTGWWWARRWWRCSSAARTRRRGWDRLRGR